MAAPPFKVKAIYEYTSEHEDDLTFPIGQVITVVELEGDDWYVGEYTDVTGAKHEGLFPSNFVEKYEPEVPTRPTRPARQKHEVQQASPSAVAPTPSESQGEAASIPPEPPTQARSIDPPVAASRGVETTASPPPILNPEPTEPTEAASTASKKAPPPVAAKSNAFKDRIAAFNQPAAAPLAPMQPGRQQPPSNFIKKPFVAPPPGKNSYIPPPTKSEPVHRPYVREEDPEIREREEEDRAAAEAAGLTHEPAAVVGQEEADEDAPKPMTLKERMALLQQQQQEQAQRRAETASKKKPPQKKPSESSDVVAAADAGDEPVLSDDTQRQSSELPLDKPRVSSTHRRPPEPMSPVPAVPDHEILSDGHEADQSGAGDLTEEDDAGTLGPDSDERPADAGTMQRSLDEEDTADAGDDEEDEVDEETRRKEELRARMARLGGGMPGMGAPFNPFGAPPAAPPRKKQPVRDRDDAEESSAQQIPQMVPVPGMPRMQSPPLDKTQTAPQPTEPETEADEVAEQPPPPPKRAPTVDRSAPPPVPKDSRAPPPGAQERSAPPPLPSNASRPPPVESRAVPPPPPRAVTSPGPGSESDDEMSTHAKRSSTDMSGLETPMPIRTGAPPIPPSRDLPPRPDDKRSSYFSGSEPGSGSSDKRSSRVAPPIPGSDGLGSPRPPPPPPPTQAPPSRQSTSHELDRDEQVESDYDGDYDTDIASSAKHRDALKAPHVREASLTENTMPSDTPATSSAPPFPTYSAPRAVPPPPPPSQTLPKTRQSMDRPPPPVPPPREEDPEDRYDPYRYTEEPQQMPSAPTAAPGGAPPPPPQRSLPPEPIESSADDSLTQSPPPRKSTDRAPTAMSQALSSAQPPVRTSSDMQRSSPSVRRSVEQARPSGEHGQIASDLPLNQDTPWWTAAQPLPPVLQDRNGVDILSECEETSKSKRGGKKEVTKDIYILYLDYSQTIISARYDSQDTMDAQLEQRHEPPPPRLRQDQLEAAWQRFGSKIAEAANALGHSKKDTVVGDTGSPYSLPLELIKAQSNALLPVGTRAYGALVYANMANASTMQYDEIRRGDIITLRNARFEGHHGAMKTKYKGDYGPSHVAIVEEWDGTRRAVRAWEQGREKKGAVRSEKFRLGDLRSGEVRVWRVVGREWVGWES